MEELKVGNRVVTPSGTGLVKAVGTQDEYLLPNEVLVAVDGRPEGETDSIFLRSQVTAVQQ